MDKFVSAGLIHAVDKAFVSEENGDLRNLLACEPRPYRLIASDISEMSGASTFPWTHFYVIGWPCQPESRMGKKQRGRDPRAKPLHVSLSYILYAKPLVVIMENVEGFTDSHRCTQLLRALRWAGYIVHHAVLNSRDTGGVPQCRRRFYLVGFLDGSTTDPHSFAWPTEIEHTPLPTIICDLSSGWRKAPSSKTASDNLQKAKAYLDKNEVSNDQLSICDTAASKKREQTRIGYSPCLTKARTVQSLSFVVVRGHDVTTVRPLSVKDMARLQGIADDDFARHSSLLSRKAHCEALGNAMTESVVTRLVTQCLPRLFRA